ncbi:hypothetical protein [Burkholderia thailandensis]|uniref:Uncharacterized protein n=1 Tax=Burkholderia thailandensis (strain ATCC 700388 / DSM 13276 / CCUG 48851 / CIP 106301 / E264) TaxID=271848 RepID=Q2T5N8_BURTA|nr:hypothetical protein [Burkholderia thailandensis]ABC35182.1 conserved hypothetical protein [Burkholderia thailandensis E264]AHI76144.1 hypothetical protein BTQ_4599 [Burkholderia thailandensis 2002721723]AHI81266.1 hypothetical protein BTJ_5582 [Burkholderia thailandensis E444]AIC89684.1 hypothetical protein BTRA_4317 [Burkholderia thailandensis USAMRU Malaysia \
MANKLNSASHPATATEIRDIIGPVEDDVIAKILEIAPTSAEVLDAYTWLRSDERLLFRLDREPHGRAARVFEILESEEGDDNDRRQ